MVDPRFGRAAWFLIIETETNELLEAIDNTAGKEAAHGAGISAAAQVADIGVEALLTGRVGPKALPVLEKGGVKAVNDISGNVRDAIAAYSGKTTTTPNTTATQPSQPVAGQGQGQGQGRGCGCGQGGQGKGQGKGQGRGQCRR